MWKTWTISNTNNPFAFSTTRKGGVSQGKYGEFNINEYCGDEADCIARNRELLAGELGIPADRILLPHQVHGVEVRRIGEDFLSLAEADRKEVLEGVDAVVTDVPEVCIGVSTADCIPVLLYDGAHHATAAIHAGWRGTVGRIVEKTVDAMRDSFHTDPSDLRAVIGPGISLANFEVGDEVYEAFAQKGFPMERIARRFAKWHIDLPLCNALQLRKTGVREENIQDSGICTYDHCDEYFSARRLGVASGRIYTGIILS